VESGDGLPYRASADVLLWPGTLRGSNDQQTIPLPVSSIFIGARDSSHGSSDI
jgi:hypothetical protein